MELGLKTPERPPPRFSEDGNVGFPLGTSTPNMSTLGINVSSNQGFSQVSPSTAGFCGGFTTSPILMNGLLNPSPVFIKHENLLTEKLNSKGEGTMSANIVLIKEKGRAPSRQGFIEVNTVADGKTGVKLKSNTFVSKRTHTPTNFVPLESSPVISLDSQASTGHSDMYEINEDGSVLPMMVKKGLNAPTYFPEANLASSTIGYNPSSNQLSIKPHILNPPQVSRPKTSYTRKELEVLLDSGKQVYHIHAEEPEEESQLGLEPIERIVVVTHGEETEEALSKAVDDVTEMLNNRARKKLAEGGVLDKESVIEITRIANPSEVIGNNLKPDSVHEIDSGHLVNNSMTSSRLRHPRKTPHVKRYSDDRTPSPVSQNEEIGNNGYFKSGGIKRQVSNDGYFDSLHDSTAMRLPNNAGMYTPNRTSVIPNVYPGTLSFTMADYPSQEQQFGDHTRTYNRDQRGISNQTYVIQSGDTQSSLQSYDDLSFDHDEDSQNDSRDDSFSNMNDSLTNIHWLGHMKGDNLQVVSHKDMRLIASEKQIEKVNIECGKDKRPPYSYMHLIQMAICSKPDKKMTLKDIYNWIEAKFPYYKSNPNKGWRNSIRHNLSLYDIFVREKLEVPGKPALSYWTLRSDVNRPRASATYSQADLNDSLCVKADPDSPILLSQGEPTPVDNQTCLYVPRKRPVSLLPKPNPPDPAQTYALIPIQGGVPVVPSQPILVPANWSQHSQYPIAAHANDTSYSVKRTCSPLNGPKSKHIKIAPKLDMHSYTTEHQRSWLSATALGNASGVAINVKQNGMDIGKSQTSGCQSFIYNGQSLDSSEFSSHYNTQVRSVDSGIASLSENSQEVSNYDFGSAIFPQSQQQQQSQHQTQLNRSLTNAASISIPSDGQPVRRSKRKRKSPHTSFIHSSPEPGVEGLMLLNDSNVSGISDILASLEKDLKSSAKRMLKTPPTKSLKSDICDLFTSTPFKEDCNSPSWISPIRGLMLEGGDGDLDSALFTPPRKKNKKKTSTPLVRCTTPPLCKLKTPPIGGIGFDPCDYKFAVRYNNRNDSSSPIPSSSRSNNNSSPQLGSLSSLGLAGLTPLKSSPRTRSRNNGAGDCNTPSKDHLSLPHNMFGKLLGDLHLDSMIDDGISDMGNLSFSSLAL